MIRRREVAFVAGAAIVALVCVRLGLWQLDRLRQRRARNAEIAAARARPPIELQGQGGLDPDTVRDRRLRARGAFDYERETLWRARTYEGVPGVDLITPLRLPDGSAVLVDRGWVPSPDAVHIDHRTYREGDSAEVLGIGMRAPRGWADVDPKTYRDSVPYPLLAFLIQQLPPEPAAAGAPSRFIRRWPAPALDEGPHLSYAVQWFSFATIALFGTVLLLRKGRREAKT